VSIAIQTAKYGGDPGLFSFVGKAVKGVAKLAGKVVGGVARTVIGATPVGQVIRTVAGVAGVQPVLMAPRPSQPMPGTGNRFTGIATPFGAIGTGQVPAFGFGGQPGAPATFVGPNGQACRGHMNKGRYWSQRAGQLIEPGTVCVANRRTNPLNPRALSRAMRRVAGFTKAARTAEKMVTRLARRSAPRRAAFGSRPSCKTCKR